jgi:hypothetical protein
MSTTLDTSRSLSSIINGGGTKLRWDPRARRGRPRRRRCRAAVSIAQIARGRGRIRRPRPRSRESPRTHATLTHAKAHGETTATAPQLHPRPPNSGARATIPFRSRPRKFNARRRSGTEIAPGQITPLILIDLGLAACWLLPLSLSSKFS